MIQVEEYEQDQHQHMDHYLEMKRAEIEEEKKLLIQYWVTFFKGENIDRTIHVIKPESETLRECGYLFVSSNFYEIHLLFFNKKKSSIFAALCEINSWLHEIAISPWSMNILSDW